MRLVGAFVSGRTSVMGILNATPDSFSDGGRFASVDAAVERAREMVDEGADLIDVGGESTRPGADEVAVDEEIARTVPIVERIATYGVPVSIDTRKATVAKAALDAGATMVNAWLGATSPSTAGTAASTCDGWTTTTSQAFMGYANTSESSWAAGIINHPCSDNTLSLYCLEQ